MTYVLFLLIDTPFIRLFVTASFQFEKELLGRLSHTSILHTMNADPVSLETL